MFSRLVDDGAAGVLYLVGMICLTASAVLSIVPLVRAIRDY